MLDLAKKTEIARSLDDLAAQEDWNADVWQRCSDLVLRHMDENDLLGYVHDDLIHHTPVAKEFNPYRQECRHIATALRSACRWLSTRSNTNDECNRLWLLKNSVLGLILCGLGSATEFCSLFFSRS
jgi:hypothetical protein